MLHLSPHHATGSAVNSPVKRDLILQQYLPGVKQRIYDHLAVFSSPCK